MHRVAVFMGTRPEAIKMAPVIRALDQAEGLSPLVISTGQHREMLAQVVDLFGLQVDHDLDVMQPNQTLASLSARLIMKIDELIGSERPDMALVQGDTTTVLPNGTVVFTDDSVGTSTTLGDELREHQSLSRHPPLGELTLRERGLSPFSESSEV